MASVVDGIFAPSTTSLQPNAARFLASEPVISFCVADGNAIVTCFTSHGFFPAKNSAVDDSFKTKLFAYRNSITTITLSIRLSILLPSDIQRFVHV